MPPNSAALLPLLHFSTTHTSSPLPTLRPSYLSLARLRSKNSHLSNANSNFSKRYDNERREEEEEEGRGVYFESKVRVDVSNPSNPVLMLADSNDYDKVIQQIVAPMGSRSELGKAKGKWEKLLGEVVERAGEVGGAMEIVRAGEE